MAVFCMVDVIERSNAGDNPDLIGRNFTLQVGGTGHRACLPPPSRLTRLPVSFSTGVWGVVVIGTLRDAGWDAREHANGVAPAPVVGAA